MVPHPSLADAAEVLADDIDARASANPDAFSAARKGSAKRSIGRGCDPALAQRVYRVALTPEEISEARAKARATARRI